MAFVEQTKPVILVTHEYPPKRGGAGVYCQELARACSLLQIPSEVWAPKGSLDQLVRLQTMKQKGSQDWSCSWRLLKYLQGNMHQAAILHLADPGVVRACVRFGWMIPKLPPLVITIHGSELLLFTRNPLTRFLFRKLLFQAKTIHVLSQHNRSKLMELCPTLGERILRIPGAPSNGALPVDEIGNPSSRVNQGNTLIILCVARIHPRKGQLELLHALRRMPEYLKKTLELRFVGPVIKPSYLKKLQLASRSCGFSIVFCGDLSTDALRNAYATADVFAMSSAPHPRSVEGFGFVYLEASAHGLPIVAHRVGGVEDAVIDGETGLLADPNEPDDLRQKLKTILLNPELREKMARKGREWASSHSWERVAKALYLSP